MQEQSATWMTRAQRRGVTRLFQPGFRAKFQASQGQRA
eukprot:CAMPEP_0181499306 /NCGR_PEP_ID=MMETSP1110-20121109/54583_1 /TAXON_ID=174948 /ORGANISM="Symbiodinium sp., Strain CCMP421" /LENGTH=37 /DNA_ID= /DNA_START= /DNA_END= /DNA_ORIENTATION=